MKLSVGKKVSYESGPNMTPLVDIVMVLLIFLMIAGTFAGQERYLVSTVPLRQTGAGGATPPPGGFPRDEPLEIHVTSPVPDRFTARVGQYKAESAGELQQAMRQLLQQLVAAGKRPEDLQVVIAPDRAVKYKFLIDVYTAAQMAGFQKVGFSTTQ